MQCLLIWESCLQRICVSGFWVGSFLQLSQAKDMKLFLHEGRLGRTHTFPLSQRVEVLLSQLLNLYLCICRLARLQGLCLYSGFCTKMPHP